MAQPEQVMLRGKNEATLFPCRDTGTSTAVARTAAFAYFHEHQRSVGVLHDEVDFTAAAPGCPEIPNQ